MRILLVTLLFVIVACESVENIQPSFYACSNPSRENTFAASLEIKLQQHIDNLTHNGLPGIIWSIDHPQKGYWKGASGMADIANGVPMKTCTISRAGSTVKTFTAVSILLLAEEGLLSLDDKAASYLSPAITNRLENANSATIRQLLNHTSGIYNYIQDVKFQMASLNDLTRIWQPEELLSYAYNRKAYFAPGAGFQYSNTNYVLLGIIIEKITHKHFTKFFKERLFDPYKLSFTSFDINDPIPTGLARGYVDFYSNKQLTEATYFSGWDYYTADGGLISNPQDLSLFFGLLFTEKIVSKKSLEQMMIWNDVSDDPDFFQLDAGLGIFRFHTPYGIAYGHSGDAIGYYASVLYFPDSGISMAWQTNGNYGTLDRYASSKDAFTEFIKLAIE